MNPNTPSFSFDPAAATTFVPGGGGGRGRGGQGQGQGQGYQQGGQQGYYNQYAQQQQHGQYQQGGYYGAGYGQQQYGGYQQGGYGGGAYNGQQQQHAYQQYQPQQQTYQSYSSQQPNPRLPQLQPRTVAAAPESWDQDETAAASAPAPAPAAVNDKPKTISIGSSKPAASAGPAAAATSSDKPASISLSIGGGAPKKTEAAAAPAATTAAPAKAAAPPAAKEKEKDEPAAKPSPAKAASKADDGPKKAALSVGPAAAKVERSADQVAEHVAQVADEDTLKDLYGTAEENAAVLAGSKEHVNIVFIGHVDAGKSTMGGRILVECGMVDKRTLEKYEKEAKDAGRETWYLSFALDSTQQERAQGKTVEVGRAYFETDKRRYTILDAPGHKSFVPSMISGAAQADVAVLVISARKGEFETGFEKGGQTREHIVLVKTAGIQKLVVAINKMDDITVEWAKERYDEIVGKLTPYLKGIGFNPKTEVTFMPVSGYTGAGIKERIDKKVANWFDGPALLEHLDGTAMSDRKLNAPFMMPISEKYKDMGTVVVGKVESGKVKVGSSLLVMPNKNKVEVTAIFSENEEEVQHALCGDNVRLRLRGIDDEDISVGFVLSDARQPVHAVQAFEAQLAILDHKNIICAGYSAVLHVHTAAEEITLSALLHYYDKKTGRKSRRPPQFAKKGQKIVALVEVAVPVCIEPFAKYPQLGRFTLRDEGKTIAIGKVTKLIEKADEMPNVAALNIAGASGAAGASTAAAGAA